MKSRRAVAAPCAGRPSGPSVVVSGSGHKSSWCLPLSAQSSVPRSSVGTCEESAGAGMAQSPHRWGHLPWHQNPHLTLELRKRGEERGEKAEGPGLQPSPDQQVAQLILGSPIPVVLGFIPHPYYIGISSHPVSLSLSYSVTSQGGEGRDPSEKIQGQGWQS